MISFHYENVSSIADEPAHQDWIHLVAEQEGYYIREIAYIFTTDSHVLKLNKKFLGHDYYTDILTFDRSENKSMSGDIFISRERVAENALLIEVNEEEELRRVMIHGILHMMGYSDKNEEKAKAMRLKEDEYLKLFHVEH